MIITTQEKAIMRILWDLQGIGSGGEVKESVPLSEISKRAGELAECDSDAGNVLEELEYLENEWGYVERSPCIPYGWRLTQVGAYLAKGLRWSEEVKSDEE